MALSNSTLSPSAMCLPEKKKIHTLNSAVFYFLASVLGKQIFGKHSKSIFFANGLSVVNGARRGSVEVSCAQRLHLQIPWGLGQTVLEDASVNRNLSEGADKCHICCFPDPWVLTYTGHPMKGHKLSRVDYLYCSTQLAKRALVFNFTIFCHIWCWLWAYCSWIKSLDSTALTSLSRSSCITIFWSCLSFTAWENSFW